MDIGLCGKVSIFNRTRQQRWRRKPMGVIDKNRAALKCPKCNTTETLTAVEKGSVYGRSGWGTFDTPKLFDITISDRGVASAGPIVSSAKCKKCDCDAEVDNM